MSASATQGRHKQHSAKSALVKPVVIMILNAVCSLPWRPFPWRRKVSTGVLVAVYLQLMTRFVDKSLQDASPRVLVRRCLKSLVSRTDVLYYCCNRIFEYSSNVCSNRIMFFVYTSTRPASPRVQALQGQINCR